MAISGELILHIYIYTHMYLQQCTLSSHLNTVRQPDFKYTFFLTVSHVPPQYLHAIM